MKISAGKLRGMEALSDASGIISAAAMDQRGSLKKAIAKEKGVDPKEITSEMMAEFKVAVCKVLTPHASAILLDPEYGLPAVRAKAPNAGVLLAYENSGYDNTRPGRIPELLDDVTVRQLAQAGADAIKILLYYTPFESKEVNAFKHAWTERIGAECADRDIPYFLEFVGYDPAGGDVNTLEYAKKKPEIVAASMQEFSKPQYQVDVLKAEIPVNMKFTEGTKSYKGEKAYSKSQALDYYRNTAKVTRKPFIYLSAGVDDDEFRESLELAAEAGVAYNGVLCGRATWKEGIPVYAKQGVKALEAWLSDRGVKNIKALNDVLAKGAKPWAAAYESASA
ncbi:MAG: tagatose 1,6-diphosphate aldolase [Candidatus Omnitrophota bacterium]|nr:tagatose 1,6-diphosphate aldolase [Candidatus Omnitrophota bacterium]